MATLRAYGKAGLELNIAEQHLQDVTAVLTDAQILNFDNIEARAVLLRRSGSASEKKTAMDVYEVKESLGSTFFAYTSEPEWLTQSLSSRKVRKSGTDLQEQRQNLYLD